MLEEGEITKEIETGKKAKKPRSEAQKAAFAKARKALAEKRALAKEEKKKPKPKPQPEPEPEPQLDAEVSTAEGAEGVVAAAAEEGVPPAAPASAPIHERIGEVQRQLGLEDQRSALATCAMARQELGMPEAPELMRLVDNLKDIEKQLEGIGKQQLDGKLGKQAEVKNPEKEMEEVQKRVTT